MNEKLKKHMEDVFRGVPQTSKSAALKEKLSGKLNEKYIEFLEAGKSADEAADKAIEEMKDMETLIKTLEADAGHDNAERTRYRRISARLFAAALVLYILGTGAWFTFSIGIVSQTGEVKHFLGLDQSTGIITGMVSLFVMYAAATGLLIYRSYSIERILNYDEGEEQEKKRHIKNVRYMLWPAVMLSFVMISFMIKRIDFAVLAVLLLAAVVLERLIVVIVLKRRRTERRREEILNTPLEKFSDMEIENLAKKYKDDEKH